MKKFFSIVIAIIFIIAVATPVFAASSLSFSASNVEVFAGDEFTVDIFISDNSLLKSVTLLVQYDSKKLTFLDAYSGAIASGNGKNVSFKEINGASSGQAIIQIEYSDSSASLSSGGKMFTLVFVADDNAVGNTNIELSASGGKATTSSGAVAPVFNQGKVNIINNVTVPVSTTVSVTDKSETENVDVSESSTDGKPTVPTSTEQISNTEKNDDKTASNSNDKMLIIVGILIILIVIVLLIVLSQNNKPKKKHKKKSRR